MTLLNDCVPPAIPAATLALSCADGGVKAVMTNTGGHSVDFIVKKDDVQVGEPVTVAAGGSKTEIYAMDEDATAEFAVSAPGMTEVVETVTRNCQEPAVAVMGIQLTQPDVAPAVVPAVLAELPRTGSQPGGLALFAAALGVLGLGLRRMTRRPDSTG